MNTTSKYLITISLVTGLLLIAAITISGCKKSEPEPSTPAMPTMEKASETAAKTAKVTEETMDKATEAIEQTTCPVMDGNKIDKNVFIEYEGKKVYFCCPDCIEKFKADPEKYIAKLPQFQEK
jgi:YHS domain-containing protein